MAARANVLSGVAHLSAYDSFLAERMRAGTLQVVGATTISDRPGRDHHLDRWWPDHTASNWRG